MDHCLLFYYCILAVHIYAHILFSVLIEFPKYKLLSSLAIAPSQDITVCHYVRIWCTWHHYMVYIMVNETVYTLYGGTVSTV